MREEGTHEQRLQADLEAASAASGSVMVRASDDVPSGDGSTTRAYARYQLPVTAEVSVDVR